MQYTLKKSLGQHFLKDENICRKIVQALEQAIAATQLQQVLEVGPGAGALTKYLIGIPGIALKAVELDDEKVAFLESQYPQIKDKIIHENFLDIEMPFDDSFIVIGNFPYNISTQILFKVLDWKAKVPLMIGMFQKEVAQRISSDRGTKSYGILSVLVQAFYTVEYLFDVAPGCFTPPPKVMSGVIKLEVKKDVPVMHSEKLFFLLVKTAFNQRRKMLRNAVKSMFDESVLAEDIFTKRAEQLSIDDFASLTHRMKMAAQC